MIRKKGRPKSNHARDLKFSVRLNRDKDLDMLIFLMEEQEMSASEVIRDAIKCKYNEYNY